MPSPYLISRYSDPLFALFIGLSAAWLRIRREEVARWTHAHDPAAAAAASARHSMPLAMTAREAEAHRARPDPPTHADTFGVLVARVRSLKPSEWNLRAVMRDREKSPWGVVDGPQA